MSKDSLFCFFIIFFLFFSTSFAQEASNQIDTEQHINYRRTETNQLLTTDYNKTKEEVFPLGWNTGTFGKVTTGTGVWTELNPNVPRTDYLCVHFVGDAGWAVGAEGAIILSTNNGEDWQVISSPTNNVLLNVDSYNGQVVIITGYDGIILKSSDSGETFNLIPSGVSGDLWRVKMLNDTLGWIAGMGPALLKTTDTGLNWQVINTGYNSFHYWSLAFPTKDIGYVACSNGNVLKTTDGGINWQLKNIGDNRSLYSIVAFDTMHIIAGGALGKVAYTYDAGNTWGLTTAGILINSIAFLNDTLGYAVGNDEYSYYNTTDAGITWDYISTSPFPIGPYWIMFKNESIGFNAGLDLTINKSIDSGFNWLPTILNDDFKDIFFTNETTGYIIGRRVYKTSNGGESWYTLNNFPYNLTGHGGYSLSFTDSLTGFVGAYWSWIFKTTNSGVNWQQVNISGLTDTIGQINRIFFITHDVGWAVTSASGGGIIKTIDGGDNWFAQLNLPADGFRCIFFSDSLNGWATSRYIWNTTDGGTNWTERTNIPIYSRDIYFADSLYGWVIVGNELYYTSDGGINWTLDPQIYTYTWYFETITDSHFIITGTNIYESTDRGIIWENITNQVGNGFSSLHAPRDYLAYGVGTLGLIVSYLDSTIIPVELAFFTGEYADNKILLRWQTASETNNRGFEIERVCSLIIPIQDWEKIGFVEGHGTTTEEHSYSFTDLIKKPGNYFYRLKQIDFNGTFEYSNIIEVKVNSPLQYRLSQNYPNPFNSKTVIVYQIPEDEFVTLQVYDVLGRLVTTLVEENKMAGYYKKTFSASELSSGVYFYKLTAGEYNSTKKLILLE